MLFAVVVVPVLVVDAVAVVRVVVTTGLEEDK
jgi:hypothetical protein